MTCIFTLIAASCGKQDSQVPDKVIQWCVDNYLYENGLENKATGCTWSAIHSPDKSTHTDQVFLEIKVSGEYGAEESSCNLLYQYNKASDIWEISKRGEWSEPIYSYNNGLLGCWNINRFNNSYEICVEKVRNNENIGKNKTEIELSCNVRENIYAGLFEGNIDCYMYEEDIGIIQGDYMDVMMNLPEHFYSSWVETGTGQNEDYVYLTIHVDPYSGIDDAFIYAKICYTE